jgi:cellulose synthase/poly-beta-1,6-N-acetylglucosamine synthase-like glycosyltransferase
MLRTPPRPVAPRVPIAFSKQPASTNPDVERYREYLVKHVTRSPDTRSEQEYAHRANAIHQYRGKQVHTFAPFHPERSAVRTWTPAQIALCSVLAVLVVLGFILIGLSTLTVLFAFVTVLYTALLGLSVAWIAGTSKPAPVTPFDENTIAALARAPWPTYTILCPLYRERAIVPQFVEAMRALDYPSDCLQVLFLTESDDDETRRAILGMRLPDNFNVLTVPPGTPRTKPRACNYGLLHATGEYVVIYDAEDVPDPLQLKKAVLTFASVPPEVACVQAKLNYYNPYQNILTRWFTVEYSLWFDLILPGLQRIGFALPLGGTSNHFRASMLRALGAWDAFNVTEDCDLGLKLAEQGLQTVVMDSTTYEEANSRPLSWIKQRSRWIKGYMQTYLVHTRHPLKSLRRGKIKDALSLHLFVGTGSMILLVNPIMWAMFAAYLVWRPVALYHQLFPWPVLYAGMGCFLLGNFLPVYASMVACVKREHYGLVKWCLLLPLYWVLASIAAFMAGYELIVKPHYWHKTQHGLHLKSKGDTSKVAAVKAQAMQQGVTSSAVVMAGVTASVKAMPTVLTPAVKSAKAKRARARDPWLVLTVAIACVCSVAATAYFFVNHEVLLYQDAISHERIARSAFDSLTPGLAQLGTVWLPLPHVLMWPFLWNNYLWESGLAGSFIGMVCYVCASVFIFLIGRKVTGSSIAGTLSAMFFMLNPNILYLQSTPLSELVCIMTLVMSIYFLVIWIDKESISSLVLLACSTFLATLARYDGWPLPIAVVCIILLLGIVRKYRITRIQASLITFSVPAFLGIILWFVWNKIIFGDFLYFAHGPFSASAQQAIQLAAGRLMTYHDLLQSIRYYAVDTYDSVGAFSFVISIPLFMLIAVKSLKNRKLLAVMAFCYIFCFYVYSLYGGQAIIWVPGARPLNAALYYNTRYGAQMIAPIGLVVGCGLFYIVSHLPKKVVLKRGVLLLFAFLPLFQSAAIVNQGVISLQDGQYNVSCSYPRTIDAYMYEHYNGGLILNDVAALAFDSAGADIDFKNVVYEGSNTYWTQALKNPASIVTWVVANPTIANDLVSQHINVNSVQFLSQYRPVVKQGDGAILFYKIGASPLPDRTAPPVYTYPHQPCVK